LIRFDTVSGLFHAKAPSREEKYDWDKIIRGLGLRIAFEPVTRKPELSEADDPI
jgi:hypothetical protein